MFRDERQQAQACRALLTTVRWADLWTDTGPTKAACDILDRGSGGASSGEMLMLRAAFDLWGGHGHMDFARAVNTLDNGNLRRLGTFLVAFAGGSSAIDRWLAACAAEDAGPVTGQEEVDSVVFIVMEYWGRGDPFFGGTGDDRPLGRNGVFLRGFYRWNQDVAKFSTREEAERAVARAHRRPGGFISIIEERSQEVDRA